MLKKYISIGKKDLKEELFEEVRRNHILSCPKPVGGLWASVYEEVNPYASAWGEFVYGKKRFKMPVKGVVFNLKEKAHILTINNLKDIEELKKLYPSFNGFIDFEALSLLYDGMFINYNNMSRNFLSRYCVANTLQLFNLSCIEEYYTVSLFSHKEASMPKEIENPSLVYYEFFNFVEDYFREIMKSFDEPIHSDSYEKYLKMTKDLQLDICAQIIFNFGKEYRELVKQYGLKEAYYIVIAIVGNLLRYYYSEDKENILKLTRKKKN